MTFNGKAIIELRNKKGVSRYKLCKDLDLNYMGVYRLENNLIEKPHKLTLLKLSNYFKVKEEDLFEDTKKTDVIAVTSVSQ